jgi:uncharacterized protein YrrD
MQKISEVLKKPITSQAEGKEVGKAKDVILDETAHRILGFLMKEKSMTGPATILPFSSISSIEQDAVIIENESMIVEVDSDPFLKEAVEDKNKMKGKKMISEEGDELGSVGDLLFDEKTGKILDLEVTQGKMKDMKQGGPMAAPVDDMVAVGESAVIMEADTSLESEKAVMAQASQSPPPAPKEQSGGLMESLKEKVGEMKEKATGKKDEKKEQNILGKTATRAVLDKDDNVLLNKDDIITHEAIEKAKAAGVEDLLYMAGEGK